MSARRYRFWMIFIKQFSSFLPFFSVFHKKLLFFLFIPPASFICHNLHNQLVCTFNLRFNHNNNIFISNILVQLRRYFITIFILLHSAKLFLQFYLYNQSNKDGFHHGSSPSFNSTSSNIIHMFCDYECRQQGVEDHV